MKKLAHFLLRDILSDGPAGTVYKADEVLPGDNRRTVALKVLPPIEGGTVTGESASEQRFFGEVRVLAQRGGHPSGVTRYSLGGTVTGESASEQRFFGEVRVLAQLAVHPNVVTIYSMGITEDYPWLAMEFSPNTLAQKISDAPADPADILRTLEQTARGLAAMHALKPPLIHQDLKPANILLDTLGNCKITDFSLATVTAAHKTHGIATVRYAAPELLSSEFGRVGPATDLYALGHIAYEMALGQRTLRQQFPAVFEGNTGKEPPPNKWMMWHASISMKPAAPAEVVRGFPSTLSEIIARLIAKPIPQRYASADELLSDLALARGEVLGTQRNANLPMGNSAPVASSIPAPPAAVRPAASELRTPPPPASTAKAASTAGAAVPGAGGVFWVRFRGKVSGPFDLPTLQRQVKQGQLSRMHQVSADQVTWKNAPDIEGLYGPTLV